MIAKFDIEHFYQKSQSFDMKKIVLISFTLIIFSIGYLVSSSSQVIAKQPDDVFPKEIQSEALRGGYQLIGINGLRQLYQQDDQNLFLVDTRQDWEFHSGHIKNASNFPMEPTWLARLTQRGPLEQFLGKDKSKTIVFY